MNIRDLIEQCADTTKAKGFDVTQHGTQLVLMATEIGEALVHVSEIGDPAMDVYAGSINYVWNGVEQYRAIPRSEPYEDESAIWNIQDFLEELADIQIRLCSYIGGNGFTEQFILALLAKMEKNKNRPMKHGKAF